MVNCQQFDQSIDQIRFHDIGFMLTTQATTRHDGVVADVSDQYFLKSERQCTIQVAPLDSR